MDSRLLNFFLNQADPVGAARTIEEKQLVGIAKVKRAAETARKKFITPGSGKTKEYTFKQDEVKRYRSAAAANETLIDSDYPWAVDRAALLTTPVVTVSVADVITEWETIGAGWEAVARQIAKLEEAATEAIRAATNEAQIRAAMAISWPTPQ